MRGSVAEALDRSYPDAETKNSRVQVRPFLPAAFRTQPRGRL